MLKASLCTLGSLALLTASSADAALVVNFGGAANRLDPGDGAATQDVLNISDANTYTTGSFVTTGAGPVTFDLNITSTNGNIDAQSTNGLGVSGGSAGQGVDNQSGTLETLAFTISDFTGLGAGESLVITEVELLFGANGGETYTINGSGNISFAGTPETVDIPDDVTVTIGAGTAGDTRFAVGSITVAVVPEPSSLALLGLGGLLIARRRRSAAH